MAYQKGDLITTSEINGLLTTVRALYGQGSNDRGYGQVAITQDDLLAGADIESAHWTNLRNMIAVIATHQGTPFPALPPTTLLEVGDTIVAHKQSAPSNNPYDIENLVTSIDTNRLNRDPAGMNIINPGYSVVLSTSWTGARTCVIDVNWASENEARYFFNAAGEIILNVTVTATDAPSTDWSNALAAKVGLIRIKARSTTNDGTEIGGTTNGFYNLTDSAISLLSITNFGGVAYLAKDINVSARRLGYVGASGGNGTGIRITIEVDDNTGETMTGILTADVTLYKSQVLVGIDTPVLVTNSEWSV